MQNSGIVFQLLAKSTEYYHGQVVIFLREVTPPLQGRIYFISLGARFGSGNINYKVAARPHCCSSHSQQQKKEMKKLVLAVLCRGWKGQALQIRSACRHVCTHSQETCSLPQCAPCWFVHAALFSDFLEALRKCCWNNHPGCGYSCLICPYSTLSSFDTQISHSEKKRRLSLDPCLLWTCC